MPQHRRNWLRTALGAALLPMTGRGAMAQGTVAQGTTAPAATAQAATAPDWPAKPIRIVAPFPPGGSADILGRLIGAHFTERFKQSVVIDNRAGAGGAIGSEQVSKAAPDGYTLLVSGIGSHVIAPAVSKTPYHPLQSFTHIALCGGPPAVLAVPADSPVKTVREFIAASQAADKGLSWGSSGTGTHAHLIGEMFRELSGARMVHVSYKGGSQAMTDLIGKQLPATLTALTSATPQLRAGRIRALAITSRNRLAGLPGVPTFIEAGFAQLTAITWFSLSGPPGMAAPLVAQINAEVRRALHSESARERLQGEGIEPNDLDAAAFTQFVRTELDRWTPLAKAAQTTH